MAPIAVIWYFVIVTLMLTYISVNYPGDILTDNQEYSNKIMN
jgi:hypothetical protein